MKYYCTNQWLFSHNIIIFNIISIYFGRLIQNSNIQKISPITNEPGRQLFKTIIFFLVFFMFCHASKSLLLYVYLKYAPRIIETPSWINQGLWRTRLAHISNTLGLDLQTDNFLLCPVSLDLHLTTVLLYCQLLIVAADWIKTHNV